MKSIAEGRKDVFMVKPENLTLVYDKAHPLYDPRVEIAPPESMIANIAMNGVIEPVIVRKNGVDYEIVAGRRRTKSAIEANNRLRAEGKPPILVPCIMRGGTDADLFGVMVSENEIRHEDTMIIKGMKARKLLDFGYSEQQIAVTFGVSRQAVENWLAADELPQELKNAIESGEITATAAVELAKGGQSKQSQIQQFEDLKKQGKKPTVHNVSASPKVRRRKEIEKHLDTLDVGNCKEFEEGYAAALRWVLGENEDDESEEGGDES